MAHASVTSFDILLERRLAVKVARLRPEPRRKSAWFPSRNERAAVLTPIEELRQAMTRIAVVSLVAVGALMSVLWGWLIRRWRQGERLIHA